MNSSPDENAGRAYAERTVRALGAGLRLQTWVAIGMAAVAFLAGGKVAAGSSFCGSLAVYLPGWLFTALVARRLGGDTAAFLRAAALAEFGKLFLTGVLCAVAFIWVRPLAPGWFFTGMIVVLATGWVGLGRAIR
ncbi:ATP synthase subunit I [Elongatibacter sediminis]|uniref:ATP synthase subunit I n=1 Tax=Elongatibacter sediminis TaxID=3119006 RepID=A0AAW9RCL8_9GAMM